MTIEVRPATVFEDLAAVLGPKKPDASVCFCLAYRLPRKENQALAGVARAERVRELCAQVPPPGVLAYDGDVPVGWAACHPRADTTFARSRTIPASDCPDVWSLWCFRVRPGHRGKGIMHALVTGAVAFARENGAPAVEGYPVDNDGERMDQTMAYLGTRALFESAGFVKVADTKATASGHPRVVMRLDLHGHHHPVACASGSFLEVGRLAVQVGLDVAAAAVERAGARVPDRGV